ncbi:MAG: sensor histidine kinase [Bacteroidota bacterium]
MQKLIKIFFFISLVGYSLLSVSCNNKKDIYPVAKKGILDLRGWDFEKDGNIPLNGEWKFYWKKLVDPNDTTYRFDSDWNIINVPGLWRDTKLKGKPVPSIGYATYRLEILIDSTNQILKLFSKTGIKTSSVLYADGNLAGANGVVGSNEKLVVASDHFEFFSFSPTSEKIEIIIQVSNVTKGYSGGISSPLKLGHVHNIIKTKRIDIYSTIFVYGCIFIFMISQFLFYFAWIYDRSFLYLAIMSLLILSFFSIDITSELDLFNFKVNHIFVNIGWIFAVPVIIYYIRSIFKELVNKYIPPIALIVAFIAAIAYLSGTSISFYRVFAIIELIYVIVISLIAFNKKIYQSTRLLVGISIMALAAINDLLFYLNIIHSYEMLHLGIFMFLFIQVYVVSSNFAKSYLKNKNLSEELLSINKNLENLVVERTKKIEDQNFQLKELITTKDRFFSIIAHDLRSPISSMLSILNMFSTHRDRFDEKSTELMIHDIHKSTDRTYNLLENLLNWARSQKGEIYYNPDNFELNSLVDANVDLINIPIENKKIKLTKKMAQDYICFADKSMIDLVIRNLLSNAIKFTPSDGEIKIGIEEQQDGMFVINIKDSGIGIKKEDLSKLFDSGKKLSTWGTEGEKGSGLGLILCKEFVEKNKGTLKVKSEEGKGSTFSFTVPKGL